MTAETSSAETFDVIAAATNRRQAGRVLDVSQRVLLVVRTPDHPVIETWIGGSDAGLRGVWRRDGVFCDARVVEIGTLSALVHDRDRDVDVDHDPPSSVLQRLRPASGGGSRD